MKALKAIVLSAAILSASTFGLGSAEASGLIAEGTVGVFSGIGDWYQGKIDVAGDTDDFRWTNDTGVAKTFFINFDTIDDRSYDYFIRSVGVTGFGASNKISWGTGYESWQIYLPAGETLTINVGAFQPNTFSSTVKYEISLNTTPWF